MSKLILWSLFILAMNASAQEIIGPIGDRWDDQHELRIQKKEGPLYLQAETFIRAEKLVIERTIVTNGFGLYIDVRELVIVPGVEIKTFDRAFTAQTFIDETLKYSAPRGVRACSITGARTDEIGMNGPLGIPGLDVTKRPNDIRIFATVINGNLNVSSDGQQGGQGGKGGTGGKGLDGCKGLDGKASCSGFLGTGNGNGRHGEGGKTGARGGFGGVGGVGGRGGENGRIFITYLRSAIGTAMELTSRPGKGGQGGEPGDNGLSGAGGPGGDRDKKECGTFWDKETVVADAGNQGPSLSIQESKEEKERRRGSPGESGAEIGNTISVKSFLEIKTERENVISKVMEFHFSRVFYQLTQQTLLIVLNQDETVDAENLTSINESARIRLLSDWKDGFVKPLEREAALDESLREQLVSARELILVLDALSLEKKDSTKLSIKTLLKRQKSVLGQKIKRIAGACRAFIDIDSGDLENKTDLFTIPLCYDFQELTQNPFVRLVVSRPVNITTGGLAKDDFVLTKIEAGERTPSSDFQVVIMNGRKFGVQHFYDLYRWKDRESLAIGTLRTLQAMDQKLINLNNLGAYARLLRSGMK